MPRRSTRTAPQTNPEDIRPSARPPIRERKRKGGTLVDKFALPPDMIADLKARGMSVEWKRETTIGQNDPSYDIFMREQGWEPIMGDRYPDFVMQGEKAPIRRDGMILMERPIELTEEAKQEERDAAREAVSIKEQQLGVAGKGEFQRHRADGSSTVRVTHTMESGAGMEID